MMTDGRTRGSLGAPSGPDRRGPQVGVRVHWLLQPSAVDVAWWGLPRTATLCLACCLNCHQHGCGCDHHDDYLGANIRVGVGGKKGPPRRSCSRRAGDLFCWLFAPLRSPNSTAGGGVCHPNSQKGPQHQLRPTPTRAGLGGDGWWHPRPHSTRREAHAPDPAVQVDNATKAKKNLRVCALVCFSPCVSMSVSVWPCVPVRVRVCPCACVTWWEPAGRARAVGSVHGARRENPHFWSLPSQPPHHAPPK